MRRQHGVRYRDKMKKLSKLPLRRETVRLLANTDLSRAIGGEDDAKVISQSGDKQCGVQAGAQVG